MHRHLQIKSFARLAPAMLALTTLTLLEGCGNRSQQEKPLVMLFTCDTEGWIVPCGCSSDQAGGLARRATYVDQVRQQANVILADVGGAPAGKSAYQREKFEAILRGEVAMSIAAHNVGAAEAALGSEYLAEIAQRLNVPFVSTNLFNSAGEPIAPAVRIVSTAGRRVALLGVLSPALAPEGITAKPPQNAVLQTLREAADKYDLAVVLAYLPEEELQAFARALPEVDAVIGGPTGQSIPATRHGPTLVAAVTNKGKFIGQLEVLPQGLGKFHFTELGPQFSDHSDLQANLQDYYRRLAKADYEAGNTGLRKLAHIEPTGPAYAGTAACQLCHSQDCDSWQSTTHANAWDTLVAKQAQVDPYCQQCHTTGYGERGGFVSLSQSADRVDVGCESCHGPSQSHVENPRSRTLYSAHDQCVVCHDRENSPNFDYSEYWPMIEHGFPAEQAAETRTPQEKR